MEPGDQLSFRLRQVERRAVRFGDGGEEEDHEGERLGEDEPVGQGQGEGPIAKTRSRVCCSMMVRMLSEDERRKMPTSDRPSTIS